MAYFNLSHTAQTFKLVVQQKGGQCTNGINKFKCDEATATSITVQIVNHFQTQEMSLYQQTICLSSCLRIKV